MKYVSRLIEEKISNYHAAFPCVVLTGARQVGKSTLLSHLFASSATTFVFDPVQDRFGARRDPDLFLRNNPPPLILDEIQYVPELVPAIKRAIDADRRPGRFVLTGSQQWSVMRSLAESLAGRTAVIDLLGFSLCEVHRPNSTPWLAHWLRSVAGVIRMPLERIFNDYASAAISPADAIWRGAYPEVQTLPESVVPGWFLGYLSTYLQRDVRLSLDVRDEGYFASFVGLCAALTAQEVNSAHMGRDIGLAHTTARRWMDVLRSTYQWLELPSLTRNAVKRVSQRPKGHLWDTGLASHLLHISSPRAISGHPAFGALFESLVVGDAMRQLQGESLLPSVWHWRRHSGAEVDLILERDGQFFPIEVKASANPTARDAAGILAFQQEFGKAAAPGLVVHAGDRVLQLAETCLAIPFDLLQTGHL